jgi:ureidoglycolate lyase
MIPLPLTPESFRPFGAVIAADAAGVSANQGTALRSNHLAELINLRPGARPNLCAFRCAPATGPRFEARLLERHAKSTQLFVPMSATSRYLVIVALGDARPDLKTIQAFIASGPAGIAYAPGVWHHPMIALDAAIDFACLVWEDGGAEDCDESELQPPISIELDKKI